MRDLQPSPTSSLVASPSRSPVRMASHVEPAAPFAVIPSAIDALRGETKTLLSRCVLLISPSRSNAKALLPLIIFCSATVSCRGSASIDAPGPWGSEQPTVISTAGTRVLKKRDRVIPVSSFYGCLPRYVEEQRSGSKVPEQAESLANRRNCSHT